MKRILLLFLVSYKVLGSDVSWVEVFREKEIVVYSKETQEGLLPFRAIGFVDSNISKVFEVLMDFKTKNEWSPKLDFIKVHKKISENEYILSEYYKTPWPATDREFLLRGKVQKISDQKILFSALSTKDDKFSDSSYIQAEVKKLSVLLERIGVERTKVTFEFFGDLKGWMPIWLMNLIQKKWPFRFIESLNNWIKIRESR